MRLDPGDVHVLFTSSIGLTERWVDEVRKATDGRATDVSRSVHESTVDAGRFDSSKRAHRPTGLQGRRLALRVDAAGAVRLLSPEEGLDPLVPALLNGAPLDPVGILLPSVPVGRGATWTIASDDVARFERSVALGVAAASAPERADAEWLLERLRETAPARKDPAVTATLAGRIGDKVVVTFAAAPSPARGGGTPVGGTPPKPRPTTHVEGRLEFHVEKGRPLRLEWSLRRDVPPSPDAGDGTTPGFVETWRVEKTWK
jgi:hypothetical protein